MSFIKEAEQYQLIIQRLTYLADVLVKLGWSSPYDNRHITPNCREVYLSLDEIKEKYKALFEQELMSKDDNLIKAINTPLLEYWNLQIVEEGDKFYLEKLVKV